MPYANQAERHALWRKNMRELSRLTTVAVKIFRFGMFDDA
jgi:hypothetical protein